jgi:hypothetical protein
MADKSFNLFLSCVSDEFAVYRDALRHALTRSNFEVKIQEDFTAIGGDPLRIIDEYIEACDGVVHLVGEMTGSTPPGSLVQTLHQRHPDLKSRLPPLDAEISYVQWEAWLALYHRKPLIILEPTRDVHRGPAFKPTGTSRISQADHFLRLREMNRYPVVVVDSADEAFVKVADFMRRAASAKDEHRWPADAERPLEMLVSPSARPRMHGGRSGSDPETVGRADQNEPARCGYAGAAASGRRTDGRT